MVFLHEEIINFPSFPHKSFESDIDLLKGDEMGEVSCPDKLILYLLSATQIEIGRYKKGATWETLTQI